MNELLAIYAAGLWFGTQAGRLMIVGVRGNLELLADQRLIKNRNSHPHAKKWTKRPSLTVVIYAHNNEQTIINCLQSVIANAYKKHTIVIVDNASTDDTKLLIKNFIKRRKNVTVISKRKFIVPEDALRNVTKKVKTELLWVVLADQKFAPQSITEAVKKMNGLSVDRLRSTIHFDNVDSLFKLYYSVVTSAHLHPAFETSLVRTKQLYSGAASQTLQSLVLSQTKYEAKNWVRDSYISTKNKFSVLDYKLWIKTGWALFEALILAYFVYLIFAINNFLFYGTAWALMTALFVTGVIYHQYSIGQKLALILSAPMLFIVYVIDRWLQVGIVILVLLKMVYVKRRPRIIGRLPLFKLRY